MTMDKELVKFLAADVVEETVAPGRYSDAIGSFVKQSKRAAQTERERDNARSELADLRSRIGALAKNWQTVEVPEDADDRQRAWVEATNAAGDLLAITLQGPKVVEPSE